MAPLKQCDPVASTLSTQLFGKRRLMAMLEVPPQAQKDLPELFPELERRGFALVEVKSGGMHQYLLTFDGPRPLCIVCDRGDLWLVGERCGMNEAQLVAEGLESAFRDYARFSALVLSWLDRTA